ncbi:MAG TPA: SpoIID/LytB domain-containing protein [Gaiellaceae bacterium]|jgi:stage II sporulation protein D
MKLKGAAVIAVLAVAGTGTARAATTLIVSGHGWGHGVGMSQYGAYGYALHGWKYKRILYHYYPGTTLEKGGEPNVRVLLVHGAPNAKIGCAAQIAVNDARRFFRTLPAKTYNVGPRLRLPVRHPKGVRPFAHGVAVFSCARAPLMLNGRPYRGRLVVRRSGSTISIINALEVDDYVRGVVPSESPSRWPYAELEAQAVAARSYALAELRPDAHYDLVPDTRNQVYGGMTAERPRSNYAVNETEGQILTYDGEVARTYYSSSSGGQTESAQDAWPGSAPIPYLRSVPDPWDTYSPNHDWGPFTYSPSQLGARLGLGDAVESARIQRNSSRRVSSVGLRLSSGRAVSLSGAGIARSLGLKSDWFSIGALSVSTSAPRVLYGKSVRVIARALETTGAVLQEQRSGGVWRTLRHVDGKAVLTVEPHVSTTYRVRITGASGAGVTVGVRPQLSLEALGPRSLGGEVVPRIAGPVALWRRVDGHWRVISRPHVLRSGKFRSSVHLRPAVYRVTTGEGAFAPAVRRLVVTRKTFASLR